MLFPGKHAEYLSCGCHSSQSGRTQVERRPCEEWLKNSLVTDQPEGLEVDRWLRWFYKYGSIDPFTRIYVNSVELQRAEFLEVERR